MAHRTNRATAALLGTVLAAGLPTGLALAAGPSDLHGVGVSAFARINVGGPGHGAAVSSVARTNGTSTVDETSKGAPATHPANHGAAVSAVAKDQSLVGGKHHNHGGAVSVATHKH